MYAGFWLRFVAFLVDSVLINIGESVLILILAGLELLLDGVGVVQSTKETILGIVGVPLYLSLPWLYYAYFESSPKMATIGKTVAGIKVVDLDGNRISFGRATARFWLKFLSALIISIGYIMAGFTERKQALHDIIAKTLVIKADQNRI